MHDISLGRGPAVVALDIGATGVKPGVVTAEGEVLDRPAEPTVVNDAAGLVAQLARIVRQARSSHDVRGIGVTVPGVIDDERGVIVAAENLGLHDVPLVKLLETATGVPVTIVHDVRAAARAEREFATEPFDSAVVIVIGSGIASAIYLGGEPLVAGGFAGEVGHARIMPIGHPDARPCACGGVGCLETIASASSIGRAYRERSGKPAAGSKEVFAAAAKGDDDAQYVIDRAVDALALSMQQLTSALAPEAILIGGGLAAAGDALLVPLRERFESLLTFHRRPRVALGRLGTGAGMLGAGLAAREQAAQTAPARP